MGKCVTAFRVVIFEQVIDQDSERIVMDSVDSFHHLAQPAFFPFSPLCVVDGMMAATL